MSKGNSRSVALLDGLNGVTFRWFIISSMAFGALAVLKFKT